MTKKAKPRKVTKSKELTKKVKKVKKASKKVARKSVEQPSTPQRMLFYPDDTPAEEPRSQLGEQTEGREEEPALP